MWCNYFRIRKQNLKLISILTLAILVSQSLFSSSMVKATVSNPILTNTCGLDIALILDVSGSIDATEMTQLKASMASFANAFVGTPTQFSLSKFSNIGAVVKAFPLTPEQAVTAINNNIPNQGSGYTNWDDGLAKGFSTFDPRPTKPNLIVIGTDGNPNRYGNPSTPPSGDNYTLGLAYGIARAESIKSAGTRIVAVGIGNLSGSEALNVDNLQAITGDNVAPPSTITKDTDVITSDFSQLAEVMSNLSRALCGGKVLVQTQFDTNRDGIADLTGAAADALLSGWSYDVDGNPSDPSAQTTANTGALEFSDVINGTYLVKQTNQQSATEFITGSCNDGGGSVGTLDIATKTISGFSMTTDNTISCIFLNAYLPSKLIVKTQVVNDNGGTAQPADFFVTVTGTNVSPASFSGNTDGVNITLNDGTFNVSQNSLSGYTTTYSDDCSGSIAPNEIKTCIIINDDIKPAQCILNITKTVNKTVANPGDTLIYTINVNNSGDADCTGGGVKIEDTLNPLLDFVSETHSSNIDPGYYSSLLDNGSLKWNAHVLNPGESGTITWQATVKQPAVCGEFDIANTARITANEYNWLWVNSETVHTTGNVSCTGTLTVIKHVINDNGGTKAAGDFTMIVSGNSPSPSSFIGSESGVIVTLLPGDYSVDENLVEGYIKTLGPDCSGTMVAGENKTCTVTNDDQITKGNLLVKKHVINDNDGIRTAGDFTLQVTGAGSFSQDVVGDEDGVTVELNAGDYNVDETVLTGYTKSLSVDCFGTIAAGETKTCTVTNDDIPPPLPDHATLVVIKHVINDNGSTKVAGDFTINVTGLSATPASFVGSTAGVEVSLDAGSYTVTEGDHNGYEVSYSSNCSGTIAAGETKTCTVANNDQGGGGCTGSCGGGGGGGPDCSSPTYRVDPDTININIPQSNVTGSVAQIDLVYGSDVTGVVFSNDSSFIQQSSIPLQPSVSWALAQGSGTKTVYAKFFNKYSCSASKQAQVVSVPPPEVLGQSCINLSSEQQAVTSKDKTLAASMAGKIVMQCESTNAAWYVDPASGAKYYLPLGINTYNILKQFAIGIKNSDLAKIPVGLVSYSSLDSDNDGLPDDLESSLGTQINNKDSDSDGFTDAQEIENGYNPLGSGALSVDTAFVNVQKGKIFLQVEAHGEMWYVNPIDSKRYYIPGTDQSAVVVSGVGECISDDNSHKLAVGLAVNNISLSTISSCYPPAPKVLGATTELPRTGFPADWLLALPLLSLFGIGLVQIGKEWVVGV